jgi:hypothetical protein
MYSQPVGNLAIGHLVNPYVLLNRLNHLDEEGYWFTLVKISYGGTFTEPVHCHRNWRRDNFLDKPYSARSKALITILKTRGDSADSFSLPATLSPSPITCHKAKLLLLQEAKVLLSPQAVEESFHVHNLPSHHSAIPKLPSLRRLLALLERKRTTSWDLVATNRLWKGPFLGL